MSGRAIPGRTLTCQQGTWSGAPEDFSYAFQWVRDQGLPGEESIAAATNSTYRVATADQGHSLSCQVTATNSEGWATALSNRVVVPAEAGGVPPENQEAPSVSGPLAPKPGQVLTCAPGRMTYSR